MNKVIILYTVIILFISGCKNNVEYIGCGGVVKNSSGIEASIIIGSGKPKLQIIIKSITTKTINICSLAYLVKIESSGNIVNPSLGIMICRISDPVASEFEALIPNKMYNFDLGMEISEGALYVGKNKFTIEDGLIYDINLVINPYYLNMNEVNVNEHLARLGIINYVHEKIDCGTATFRIN